MRGYKIAVITSYHVCTYGDGLQIDPDGLPMYLVDLDSQHASMSDYQRRPTLIK